MKRLFKYIILFIFFAGISFAEEKKEYFIGPQVNFSTKSSFFKDNFEIFFGADMAFSFGHDFIVGASLFNKFSDNAKADFFDKNTNSKPNISLDFYGIYFDVILYEIARYYISLRVLTNAANVKYNVQTLVVDGEEVSKTDYGGDWFLSVEPGVNVVFEFTDWLRAGVNFGYSIAAGVDYGYENSKVTNEDLSNIFGRFFISVGKM